MTKVLLVDDDRELVDLLQFAFTRAGFEPLVANDTAAALRVFETGAPEAVVLDVNLGTTSGFDLLRELRRKSRVPIVMLTALDSEDDKVKGLELGADDYVTKPFSHRELIARVRTHLRRGQEDPGPVPERAVLEAGPLLLRIADHSVELGGRPITLTVTEFRVLHTLMRRAGSIVPNRELLKQVWGHEDTSTDIIRVTVHRLRRKLGDDAAEPQLVHTVAGVGVMVRPVERSATPTE